MTPLLEVKNLHVSYSARTGEDCPALAGVNFDLSSRRNPRRTRRIRLWQEHPCRRSPASSSVQRKNSTRVPSSSKERICLRRFSARSTKNSRRTHRPDLSRTLLFLASNAAGRPTSQRCSGRPRTFGSTHSRGKNQPPSHLRVSRRRRTHFPLLSPRIERRPAPASPHRASDRLRAFPRGCR